MLKAIVILTRVPSMPESIGTMTGICFILKPIMIATEIFKILGPIGILFGVSYILNLSQTNSDME